VRALAHGAPIGPRLWVLLILAPMAGLIHWLESFIAHDMAFRLLAEMRLAIFRKLDALAPAYLVRRRTGDLMALATRDVEFVESFFAHTIAPAFVAVLVPLAVLLVLFGQSLRLGLALLGQWGSNTTLATRSASRRRRLERGGGDGGGRRRLQHTGGRKNGRPTRRALLWGLQEGWPVGSASSFVDGAHSSRLTGSVASFSS